MHLLLWIGWSLIDLVSIDLVQGHRSRSSYHIEAARLIFQVSQHLIESLEQSTALTLHNKYRHVATLPLQSAAVRTDHAIQMCRVNRS